MKLEIYTDGSYAKETNSGAASYVILLDGQLIHQYAIALPGFSSPASELSAVILALSTIKEPIEELKLYCDCTFVLGCGFGNFQRKKLPKLWKLFDKVLSKVKQQVPVIEAIHVKGHQKKSVISDQAFWNNYVDVLAKTASTKALQKPITDKVYISI